MSIYGDFFLPLAHPLRVPNVVVKFFAFPGVVVAVIARRNRGKNEAKGKPRSERETERRCCVIFVNLTGPLPPTTPCSSRTRGPHRDGTLPTSAPDSPPPLPRRSEVNRRRGLKTTPTLSRNDPPYHGYSISFHYAPCSTDHLTTLLYPLSSSPFLPAVRPSVRPSVSLFLSFSLAPRFNPPPLLSLSVALLLTSHFLSLPGHLALLPRRRNTNADEFLLLLLAPLPLTSPTRRPDHPNRPAPSPLPFLCAF